MEEVNLYSLLILLLQTNLKKVLVYECLRILRFFGHKNHTTQILMFEHINFQRLFNLRKHHPLELFSFIRDTLESDNHLIMSLKFVIKLMIKDFEKRITNANVLEK